MAKKIKKGFAKVLSGLLKVLGISSLLTVCGCSEEGIVMYGMPPVTAEDRLVTIEGTVTDAEGHAIKDLSVEVDPPAVAAGIADVVEGELIEENDTVPFLRAITDADGHYKLVWYEHGEPMDPDVSYHFHLEVKDVDGEANGAFENNFDPIMYTDIDMGTKDGVHLYGKNNADYSLNPKETEEK